MSAAPVNPHRGEASLLIDEIEHMLRPTFESLVAAEEELGPLFALVERAAAGQLKLGEMASLFWHCLEHRDALSRETVAQTVAKIGLAAAAKPLRVLLGQILQGHG